MNTQRRSLSAALDMVEAAISSLENQARLAKLYEQKQKEEQEQKIKEELIKKEVEIPPSQLPAHEDPAEDFQLSDETEKVASASESDLETKPASPIKIRHRTSHKRHKSGRKIRSSQLGVLLHRNSTPRKKVHRRSSSSGRYHQRSLSKREKNNNSDDFFPPSSSYEKRPVEDSGYSQPTLASKMREQLTEKPKKKEKNKPQFVPAGGQGKSFHVGVIIQKELGQLKSQPLGVWTSSKLGSSKSKQELAPSSGTILERALTKA